MEVNLNSSLSRSAETVQPPARPAPTRPAANAMSFERTQALETMLNQASPLRPNLVAKAGGLVADPNYPTDGMLQQMAGLLATHLSQSGEGQ